MIRDVAANTEAATKNISSFFLQRIAKYSTTPRGLKLAIITPSNTDYERVSDWLEGRETNGSKYWFEARALRDSLSLMHVATKNRSEPNKSKSKGSTSVKMNDPFLLLLPDASLAVVCFPVSGMAVACSAEWGDAPGSPDWQIAGPGYPTHRESKMRRPN